MLPDHKKIKNSEIFLDAMKHYDTISNTMANIRSILVRVPIATADKLVRLAAAERRSLTNLCGILIDEAIAAREAVSKKSSK